MGWSGASDFVVKLKITIFWILDFSIFDFSMFSTSLFFQFPSKPHFLSHKFGDPSCRKCSYGPHGPCWFSVKNRRDMEKRYQKHIFEETPVFEIIAKLN